MLCAAHATGRMIAAARLAALVQLTAIAPIWALAESPLQAPASHGLALYGDPALPKDFDHLPYANPEAPKGGRLRLGQRGGLASLNPFN